MEEVNIQIVEGNIPYKFIVETVSLPKVEFEALKKQNEVLTKKLEAAHNYIKSMYM